MQLSQHQTNDLIFRLEERKFGRRLTSIELSEEAGVSLDYVNRIERQLPIDDEAALGEIAHALSITPGLLKKIAGYEEMSEYALKQLETALAKSHGTTDVSASAERIGLRQYPE